MAEELIPFASGCPSSQPFPIILVVLYCGLFRHIQRADYRQARADGQGDRRGLSESIRGQRQK
jgi:hypothetical protein